MLYIRLLDDAEMACHLLPSPHVYNYLGPDRMWIHRNVHVVPSQQQTCDILTWNTVKFRGGSFIDVERIDYTLESSNRGSGHVGTATSRSELEYSPRVEVGWSRSLLCPQTHRHDQGVVNIFRLILVGYLKQCFELGHTDIRGRGTVSHHKVDEVSDDCAVVIDRDRGVLELRDGGECQQISMEATVSSQPSASPYNLSS